MLRTFCDQHGNIYPMRYEENISEEDASTARGFDYDMQTFLAPKLINLVLNYDMRILDEETRKKIHKKYFYLFLEPRSINMIAYILKVCICECRYQIMNDWEYLELEDYFVQMIELYKPENLQNNHKFIRYDTFEEAKFRIIHYYKEFVKKYYKKYPWYIRLENHIISNILYVCSKFDKLYNKMTSINPNILVSRLYHRFFGPDFQSMSNSQDSYLGKIYWR